MHKTSLGLSAVAALALGSTAFSQTPAPPQVPGQRPAPMQQQTQVPQARPAQPQQALPGQPPQARPAQPQQGQPQQAQQPQQPRPAQPQAQPQPVPPEQRAAAAGAVVPGTGTKIVKVGDDFEDEKWAYNFNLPKSSQEQDKQTRAPTGLSTNNRWYEGALRGQPDVIKHVDTPAGGLAGSLGALLIRSRDSGVPGRRSGKPEQDDLILNVSGAIGSLSVSTSPNCVVRVYMPPFPEWEQRTGNTFGFRASVQTHKVKQQGRRSSMEVEPYWPGMFVYFNKGDGSKTPDSAQFMIRSNSQGGDFWGPWITETGWWTLGMSFTPNGQVHYFIHKGIEDLSAKDYVTTQNPYGYRAEQFDTFFFNVVNADNGSSWSTPWIIDDPALYYTKR